MDNSWLSLRHLAYSWNLTFVIFLLWMQVRWHPQVKTTLWWLLFGLSLQKTFSIPLLSHTRSCPYNELLFLTLIIIVYGFKLCKHRVLVAPGCDLSWNCTSCYGKLQLAVIQFEGNWWDISREDLLENMIKTFILIKTWEVKPWNRDVPH